MPLAAAHLQRARRRRAVGPEAAARRLQRVRRRGARQAREVLVHALLLRQPGARLQGLGQRRGEAPGLRLREERALVERLAARARGRARLVRRRERLVDVAHRLVGRGALDDRAAELEVVADEDLFC